MIGNPRCTCILEYSDTAVLTFEPLYDDLITISLWGWLDETARYHSREWKL